MRCGFQTLIWGRRIEDLDSALDQIAACGYEGVEVAQAPQDIWIRDPQTNAHVFVENISELLTRLNARGLTLIGLAGGRLDQRVKFCGTFRPEYLYQDNWDEETEAVTKQASPFTVGLHPHLFMPIHKLQQVKDILDKNSSPYLKFIPDTAHLTIAQDDPVQAVRMFPQRLAAVHLKDWNSSFGRYSHRYAHGFTGLGQGVVNLKGVVQALKELNFQGWIIAEQDSPEVSPAESALLCANWLATEGLPIRPDQMRLKDLDKKSCIPRISVNGLDHSLLERSYLEMTLLSTLLISQGQGAAAFYQSVTDTISSIISCTAVHLWLFSPADQRLLLVAATGLVEHITHRILDSEDFLVRRVAKAGEIQKVNLNDPATASAFRNQALLKHLPLQWLISVPIFNSSNPNHLRFVLNLFPSEWPFPDAGFLGRIGEHISRAGDSLLDQLCSAAAG